MLPTMHAQPLFMTSSSVLATPNDKNLDARTTTHTARYPNDQQRMDQIGIINSNKIINSNIL